VTTLSFGEPSQVQLETLSWLVLAGCSSCAFFVEALAQCNSIVSLHRDATREASDHMIAAMDHSRSIRAMGILRFQTQHMTLSAQLVFAQVVVRC
jgi:hypothetical protein